MDGYDHSEASLPPIDPDNNNDMAVRRSNNDAAARSNNGKTAAHSNDEDEYRQRSSEDEHGYTGVDSDDRPVLSKVSSCAFSCGC